ncbi:hypothetical protein Tco_0994833, partial [Tanacetum coccineum]
MLVDCGLGTNIRVLFCWRACNSSIIATIHLGSLDPVLKPRDLIVIGCIVVEEDGCCKLKGVEVGSIGGSGAEWKEGEGLHNVQMEGPLVDEV